MLSPPVIVFSALTLLGLVQLWGRAVADGTLANLLSALHGDTPYQLPGTTASLKSSFTGFPPVDYLLRILVVFFWEVADGSHPSSSAIGLYFLGQYFSILVAFYVDSLRRRPGAGLLIPTAWLLLFQAMGIGCAGPLWALSCIPLAAERPTTQLEPSAPFLVLGAVSIGYGAAAVPMALPSPSLLSFNSKQVALAVWNVFPLWVWLAGAGLRLTMIPTPHQPKARGTAPHMTSLRSAYIPALVVSIWSHVAVVGVSLSTCLFPSIFRSEYLTELHPSALFVPPLAVVAGGTVGDGTRSFMLWDQLLGYATVTLVMIMRLRSAAPTTIRGGTWCTVAAAMLLSYVVVGPGSTCLLISWYADVLLSSK